MIDKYENNRIWDILHISFFEYLTLPSFKMMELDAKCKKIQDIKDKREELRAEQERRDALNAIGKGSQLPGGQKLAGL